MFGWGSRKTRQKRDDHLEALMSVSQNSLLMAATETANAAQDLTICLKARLDDSIRQFEHTARIMNDALFLTEMDGTVQSYNPAAGRMFGRADINGLNVCDLFQHGADAVPDASTLWGMAEESSAWLPTSPKPLRGLRPNGALFWIEPSITRLDWSNGSSSMLVIIRNMEPIVGLSESSKANRGYKSAFDASFDGILIEQNDRIVAANPAVTRLFGYDAEEIMNRPVAILFDVSEAERVEANDDHTHFVAQGLHNNGDHISVIFTGTRIIWAGRPARLVTIKDTSEMNRSAEQAAARRDNGVDMICCFDLNYRITFTNSSFAKHYSMCRSELLNRDIRALMTSVESEVFINNTEALSVAQPSSRIQIQIGDQLCDWIDHAVFDEYGNPVEFQRVGRDISDVVANLLRL
jgi:PAS domain S-box-containing protein